MRSRASNVQPVLEKFIPMKKDCDERDGVKKEKDCKDKKNWMSSRTMMIPLQLITSMIKKQESKLEIKQVKIKFS